MAALHVLEGDGIRYRVVAHTATPVGNNSANTSGKQHTLKPDQLQALIAYKTKPQGGF